MQQILKSICTECRKGPDGSLGLLIDCDGCNRRMHSKACFSLHRGAPAPVREPFWKRLVLALGDRL